MLILLEVLESYIETHRGGKRLERLVVFLDLRLHAFEREVHSSCVRKEPV